MSQLIIAPLLLVGLCLVWLGVQRAWIACMGQTSDRDALERPSLCGPSCACRADCPRRRERKAEEALATQEQRKGV
jgi:hypothetical protein